MRLGNIIYQILFLRKLISQKYQNEFEHFESQFKKEQKQESAKAKISETDQKNLKKGNFETEAEKINKLEIIKNKIAVMQEKIKNINLSINRLENSDDYLQIQALNGEANWNKYFDLIEKDLKNELQELQKQN